MSTNPRVFRILGSDIHLHVTLLCSAALFYWGNVRGQTAQEAAVSWLFYLVVFGSILVHEFGHVLVARLYGVDCRKITLHGLGGLAHLDAEPRRASDAFFVALAGPVTSIALGGLLWGFSLVPLSENVSKSLEVMATINFVIAAFNMVPAYPLDGGQMLHAALRGFMSRRTADIAASAIAQVLGAVLTFVGWNLNSVNMMLIGAFLVFLTPLALGTSLIPFMSAKRPDPSVSLRP